MKCCTFFPFPSSHFAHVSVLLCLAITSVTNSSIVNNLSIAALTTTHPFLPNTCLNPNDWHHAAEILHCPQSFLYKLRIGTAGFLSDSWPLKMRPMDCPETSVRNCHYLLGNNQEQRSSHLRKNLLYLSLKYCSFSARDMCDCSPTFG